MEKETLKSLRAKAKELRSKLSAPLTKATPEQLKAEIAILEKAFKAEEKKAAKVAEKEAALKVQKKNEKKSTMILPSKGPVVVKKVKVAKEAVVPKEKKAPVKPSMMLYKPIKMMVDREELESSSDED